jgi:AraC-like DNA-binding protein
MLHQEFDTPEALKDTIKCFWYTRKNFGNETSSFEVIPDGYAEIIFHFGSSCSILHNNVLQALPSPFMVGLLNHPIHFFTEGSLDIIGVRCFPWTVFDLLGLPSDKKGVQVFEHPIAKLQSTMNEYVGAGKIDDAITIVEEYFVAARTGVRTDTMLFKAGIAMRRANGNIPVSEVAAAAHATIRTLERNFKQSSGHTVKDVTALMRFEQARNHLWLFPDTNIASLAYELGYTDQSHLTREFKRYSGTTPAAFVRKARKGKQTVGGDFVAFIQS